MVFMLAAALFLTVMMAAIRHVAGETHPFVIVFFRNVFGFLILSPAIVYRRFEPLRTRRLGLHAARSGACLISMLLLFMGFSLIPLAKATALQFSAPLFATVLALVVLGEIIRARRIAALVVGYVGTLVILRPGIIDVDFGSLLVLAGSATWGLGMILTKVLSRTESSLTIVSYMTLFSTPFALVVALPFWETPSSGQFAWLMAIAALSTAGDFCVAQAFKDADATAVIPLDFTRLVWAAVIGFLAFAEVPDAGTWLGGTVILAAVIYIAYRERVSGTTLTSN